MKNVIRLFDRPQRTLARSVELRGIGFLTGQLVTLRFRPAPALTGIVFVRTDLGRGAAIPAHVDQVTGTQRRTTLGRAPLCVGLVEHVLASLAGLRIDNCFVELDAPEPPGLDGSSRQFVDMLQEAGSCVLPARRAVWTVAEPVVVRQGGATLCLHPLDTTNSPLDPSGEGLRVSYFLDYGPSSPIQRQLHSQTVTPAGFSNNLASCRTFLLEEEANAFREQGLGARTKFSDLLVFGPGGPIHNKLRCADEPARHKVLDIVGDLSLLGQDLRGHVVAYRSGHPLNIELVRVLKNQLTCQLPRQSRAA
jgi:UDP-3-O-acyl N-acetylglucosamine deacetylase